MICMEVLSLTDASHEFEIHVSVSILTIQISQSAHENFCSYREKEICHDSHAICWLYSKLSLHFLSNFNSHLAEIHVLSALTNPKKGYGESIIDKKNDKLIIQRLLNAHRSHLADAFRPQGHD